MQKDINQVTLTGRLTKDPELRATTSGISVTTLRVAIQRQPGQNGADRGAAFYDVEVWKGRAEACVKYLAKGRRVAVEARLEHREWEAPGGGHRERNYLVAEEVKFLDFVPQDDDAPAAPDSPHAEAQPEAEPVAA